MPIDYISGGAGEDGGDGGLADDITAPMSAEPMPPSSPPPPPAAPPSPTRTLNWPVTITSGGPTQIAISPMRDCGIIPVSTVNEPWTIGPPTWGTSKIGRASCRERE